MSELMGGSCGYLPALLHNLEKCGLVRESVLHLYNLITFDGSQLELNCDSLKSRAQN